MYGKLLKKTNAVVPFPGGCSWIPCCFEIFHDNHVTFIVFKQIK